MARSAITTEARFALGLAAAVILAAVLIDDGTVGLVAGAFAFLLIAFAMTRMPVRYSMMGLIFFATVLPNPGEGQSTDWAPPLSIVGQALLTHLNTVDRKGILSPVAVSGAELFFFVLFMVCLYRRNTKSRLDGEVLPTPRPLILLAYTALSAGGFVWIRGMLFGGDFGMSLWQLNAVIYLPIVFLLLQWGFRGPADHWALARVYLGAGFYKCCLAAFIVYTIPGPLNPETGTTRPAYGTAHSDSMLFSLCFVIVIAMLLERVHPRVKWLAAVVLPVLAIGTNANNRRLAWVQMAVVFLIVFLVSRESRLKKRIRRTALAATPLFIGYLIAGWDSQYGGLFKPARMVRSVVDAQSDGSSMWREYENVNIIATFRSNPIFGTGYGHPYQEIVVLPSVDYSLEKYIPHNSLLGIWAYAGLIGFAGLTLLWVAGVYFAMRSYHAAQEPAHRAAAIASFGAVPIYMTQCWGDLGLSAWTGIFMMGSALTVAAKLAAATGQWQGGKSKRNPSIPVRSE